MSRSESVVPTPEQLRGISHPVRTQLLGLLRFDGPQTSTDLARRTGLTTGATSYHLRMLAQHGFIEDAPELGRGRERYWRARHRFTRVDEGSSDVPTDDLAAYRQLVLTRYAEQLQAGVAEWSELPQRWRTTTTLSDYPLRVTPAQAREVLARIDEVLRDAMARYPLDADGDCADPDSGDAQDAEDAQVYSVYLAAFPRPGTIPHRDDTDTHTDTDTDTDDATGSAGQ